MLIFAVAPPFCFKEEAGGGKNGLVDCGFPPFYLPLLVFMYLLVYSFSI
jgi:hypothetical protein